MKVGFLVLGVAMMVGCSTSPPLSNNEFSQKLVGVWCASDDGGKTCWGYDEFYADGRIDACGDLQDMDGISPEPYAARGRYELNGNQVCETVEAVSEGMALKPGMRLCHHIVSLDDRRYVFRDDRDGEKDLYYRFKGAKPCDADVARLVP